MPGVADETVEARFAAAMDRIAGQDAPPLGLAVSGGGDSVALMHLAHRRGGTLRVATVDHGLRASAAAEAETVARAADALGLPHHTIRWHWDGAGNLQAAARDARRTLLQAWAARHRLGGIILGHTLDDQAETLLLNLARGSGVEGLSGMTEGRVGQTAFLRPLLGHRRADLRDWLRAEGIGWTDDPTNEDERFDRVRARRAIAALGFDPVRLAATAGRMSRAREALERRALDLARRFVRPALPGDVVLDRAGLLAIDEDTLRRILSSALRCVAGAAYRPSEAGMGRLLDAIADETSRTLMGCVIRATSNEILIHREVAAVEADRTPPSGPWDGAWRAANAPEGTELRALGAAGLMRIASHPEGMGEEGGAVLGGLPDGYPRAALAAKPALWRDRELLGFAPLGWGVPHALRWTPPGGPFPDCLLTGR